MKRAWPAVVAVLVLLALSAFWCARLLFECDNEIVATHVSPDRRHTAVLFIRSCGATTGFSPQVALLGPEVGAIDEGRDVALTTVDRECKKPMPLTRVGPTIDGVRVELLQPPR